MLKERGGKRTEEPFWKRKIKRNIETWRKDPSKIEEVRRGNTRLKQRERERLNRNIGLRKGALSVSAVLKQKIKVGGIQIKRYDERCQQFKQNKLFRTNQKLFCETLGGKERGEIELPGPTEFTIFWSKIWSEEVSHNEKASWLQDIEQKLSTTETQEDIIITIADIRNAVNRMANWKAAGLDLVQGTGLRN